MLQSSQMAASRLPRAGALLLVVWLTADLAAFGLCGAELLSAWPASASISGHESVRDTTPPCCAAPHCFCCSSCAEVAKFELAFDAQSAFVAPVPQPRPEDISAHNTSPPPRF